MLAEEARAHGSLLVHYSTDYVFDRGKNRCVTIWRATRPARCRSMAGASLAGEQAIAAVDAPALILRTCWVAGAHGANFARTMLRLGAERDSLRVVADQFGAPTTAALIADVTAQVVARYWLAGNRAAFPAGLYHLAAAGRNQLARLCHRGDPLRRRAWLPAEDGPGAHRPIPATDYPLPAPRPANSRLDTSKLRRTFGIHLPDWQQGLHLLLDQLRP